jgi:hypothetical protein
VPVWQVANFDSAEPDHSVGPSSVSLPAIAMPTSTSLTNSKAKRPKAVVKISSAVTAR